MNRIGIIRILLWFGTLAPLLSHAQGVARKNAVPEVQLTTRPYNYMVDSWQTRDGLPANTVRGIAETPDGYLWLATIEGLVRFDGAQFKTYTREKFPALKDDNIYCLMTARDGSLWIGTEGSGMTEMQAGTFRHYNANSSPATDFVRQIYQDSDGVIWMASDGGLFHVHGAKLDPGNAELGVPVFNTTAILEDHLGRRWVGGSRLFVSDHGKAREYILPPSYLGNEIASLTETRDGSIWAGTIGELCRLSPGAKEFVRVPGVPGTVRSFVEVAPGELWASSTGGGVYRIRGQTVARLVAPDSYMSGAFSIFADSDRNLWLGTQTGISRLTRSPMHLIEPLGNQDLTFGTVSLDNDGSLWFTANQLVHIESDMMTRPHFAGMKDLRSRNLLRAHDGSLWIGTNGDGLYHITSTATLHYNEGQGLVNHNIRCLTEARDGSLWIGTDHGVSHLDGQGFHNLTEANGLTYGSIRAILEDRGGDIWIATDRGLSHLKGNTFVEDAATKTLSSAEVVSLFQDDEGEIWLGTQGNGLYTYWHGEIAHYDRSTGLVSDTILAILEDAKKRLWLSSPGAVMLLDRSELSASSKDAAPPSSMRIFFANAGGAPAQFFGGVQPAGVIDRQGDGYLPSSRGILVIHPDLDLEPRRAQVHIESLAVDGKILPAADSIDLAAASSRIEIHYEFVLLSPQDEWHFRYKLDGFDKGWTQAQPGQRVAAYTNIPPGSYRFELESWNTDYPDLKARAFLNIKQEPFYYQTFWFRALCGLGVVALSLFFYYIRVAQLHSRFQAIAAERARIAREMHDTLLQGCASVAALLHAASGEEIGDNGLRHHLIQYASTQIRATMDEARQAISSLRTESESPRDLVQSLNIMTERNGRIYGVETMLVVSGEPFPMDQPTTRAIAMIVREAVFNAILHANAESIRVELAFSPQELTLAVSDDGQGFAMTPSHWEDHYGIMGMRERVDHFGGTFRIESEPGSGTSVRIHIPQERVQAVSQ